MKPTWKVKRTVIEEIEIVGPQSESREALQWLFDNGYHTTLTGSYTDKEMHPNVDLTRFRFKAEKELEKPESV